MTDKFFTCAQMAHYGKVGRKRPQRGEETEAFQTRKALSFGRRSMMQVPKIALTPRENQVYEMVLQGKATSEISAALGITLRTVKFHLGKIYGKFGVSGRRRCPEVS